MSGSALERLVELSVCKKARLDSDSTLVAVITAVSESDRDDVTYIVPATGKVHLACIHHQHVNILCQPSQPSSTSHQSLTVIQCISGPEDFSVSEYFNNS